MDSQRSILAILIAGSLLVTGCSRPTLIPVSGKISYQDEPLPYGSIMLQPSGGGQMARATIQPDGSFTLTTDELGEGVLPGKYRVRVTAYEAQSQQTLAQGDREPSLGESLIPTQYQNFGTSGIEVDVNGDLPQPWNLELE